MASNNQTLNRLILKFCSWGLKNPYKPRGKPYLGNPAPLFKNLYKGFFIIFVILNVLVAGFDVIAYVVNILTVDDLSEICFSLQECVFVGLGFAVINTVLYLYFWRLGFASDQEWFRYMVFMVIDWVAQLIGVLTVFVLTMVRAIQAWKSECFKDARAAFILISLAEFLSLILIVI